MKKVGFKLLIGFIFALFVGIGSLFFLSETENFQELVLTKPFLTKFSMFFLLGYVLLGNVFWERKQ